MNPKIVTLSRHYTLAPIAFYFLENLGNQLQRELLSFSMQSRIRTVATNSNKVGGFFEILRDFAAFDCERFFIRSAEKKLFSIRSNLTFLVRNSLYRTYLNIVPTVRQAEMFVVHFTENSLVLYSSEWAFSSCALLLTFFEQCIDGETPGYGNTLPY